MAKVTFSNAKTFGTATKKLKLKANEKARIVILENSPSYIWAHVVRDPSDEKRARYYKCLGDEDMLDSVGKDTENCPCCAVAKLAKDAMIKTAQPRYSVNVFVYQTKSDGKTVAEPVSGEVIPWIFAPGKVKKLRELMEEYGELALERDVVLLCNNEIFQEFDMMVVDAYYKKTEAGRQAIKDAMSSMLPDEDLCKQIATELTVDQMRRMLDVPERLDESDIDAEVSAALRSLRGDALNDEELATVGDDDEEIEFSSAPANFDSLVSRAARPRTRT